MVRAFRVPVSKRTHVIVSNLPHINVMKKWNLKKVITSEGIC